MRVEREGAQTLYTNTQRPSGDTASERWYGTFKHRPETEEADTGFFELAVSVNEKKKSLCDFLKKRKIIFKKAESKKKKRNSAEKRKIDIPVSTIIPSFP